MSLREYKPVLVIAALVVLLIVAVAVISAFWPRYEERFFELGLLGANKRAEDYYPDGNSTLEVGTSVLWHVYLHNHMGSIQDVAVRIKLLNSTMEPPDDREHEPSPFPSMVELPVSLAIDETVTVPLSWEILEAESRNDSVTIYRLVVNDKIVDVDVIALSDNRFRLIFELWVYDELEEQYVFWWNSGKEVYSASLYMWFSVEPQSGDMVL